MAEKKPIDQVIETVRESMKWLNKSLGSLNGKVVDVYGTIKGFGTQLELVTNKLKDLSDTVGSTTFTPQPQAPKKGRSTSSPRSSDGGKSFDALFADFIDTDAMEKAAKAAQKAAKEQAAADEKRRKAEERQNKEAQKQADKLQKDIEKAQKEQQRADKNAQREQERNQRKLDRQAEKAAKEQEKIVKKLGRDIEKTVKADERRLDTLNKKASRLQKEQAFEQTRNTNNVFNSVGETLAASFQALGSTLADVIRSIAPNAFNAAISSLANFGNQLRIADNVLKNYAGALGASAKSISLITLVTLALTSVYTLLKSAVTIVIGGFVDLMNVSAQLVKVFSPAAYEQFNRAIMDLKGTIGEALLPVLMMFTKSIRFFADNLVVLLAKLKPFFLALAKSVEAFLIPVFNALVKVINLLTPTLNALGQTFEKFSMEFGNALAQVITDLAPSFVALVNGINVFLQAMRPLIYLFGILGGTLIPALMGVLTVLIPYLGGVFVKGILNAYKSTIEYTKAQQALIVSTNEAAAAMSRLAAKQSFTGSSVPTTIPTTAAPAGGTSAAGAAGATGGFWSKIKGWFGGGGGKDTAVKVVKDTSKAGKFAATSAKAIGTFAKSAPVIGGALSTGIDLLSGESLGNSIAGGIGTTIGSLIGGALGSFLGPAGTLIGGGLGGLIGGSIGKTIYGAFGGNNKPNQQMDATGASYGKAAASTSYSSVEDLSKRLLAGAFSAGALDKQMLEVQMRQLEELKRLNGKKDGVRGVEPAPAPGVRGFDKPAPMQNNFANAKVG